MCSDTNSTTTIRLSKLLAYTLRHNPSMFGLTLDEDGFADLDRLVQSLGNKKNTAMDLRKESIENLVANQQQKTRLEIKGNKIRAVHGHTIEIRKKAPMEPSNILYDGTPRKNFDSIVKHGLRRMERQYVHLSTDVNTATDVGKRRDKSPVVFSLSAKEAYLSGVLFYMGSEAVWLSGDIAPEYLKVENGFGMR